MAIDKEFLDEDILNFDEDEDLEKPSENKNEEIKEPYKKPKKQKPAYVGKSDEEIEKIILPKKKKKTYEETTKKLISISSKNKRVIDILKEVNKKYPSDSDFICQAIIEKYERENGKEEKDIKQIVKDILEEMVGDKYLLLKSSGDISLGVSHEPNIRESIVETKNEEIVDNEAGDLIRGSLDLWDDE